MSGKCGIKYDSSWTENFIPCREFSANAMTAAFIKNLCRKMGN